MEVKFNNPFSKKLKQLKEAAGASCKGCGEALPIEGIGDTIRTWCSRPKRSECRKLYRAKQRARATVRNA